MKPPALLLLALVGIAAASCGSGGTKAGSDPITVAGTTTISSVATGTLVSCERGVPRGPMKVPPAGHGVTAMVDGTGPSSSGKFQLTHRQDGSVVAVCDGPSGESLSASASRGSAHGHVSDLQFTYPRGYHARPFKSCTLAITGDRNGGCNRGVVIASYPLESQPEIGGSGAHFSSRVVALELYRPPVDQGLADVDLGDRRLSLWQFNPADDGIHLSGQKPPPPEQWGAWFRVNGASYWAIAWVGTHAKHLDRAKLAALINSVHRRGRTPQAPSPKPAPQVTRVLCGGTASSPRVPDNALVGAASDLICVQILGHACRVWTRPVGAPATAVRERHLQLRASFCKYTRGFLRRNPRGYSVQPARPGLTALLPRART